MQVHAELYSLVQHVLRVIGGVHLWNILGLHPHVIVVKDCINNSISDSLGYNLLSLLQVFEAQLSHDILETDLRVTDVQLL